MASKSHAQLALESLQADLVAAQAQVSAINRAIAALQSAQPTPRKRPAKMVDVSQTPLLPDGVYTR